MTIAYHDGKLVEKSALTLNPADFGFARGIALYELTRVYNGKPFRLDDHIARFLGGAKAFGIETLEAPALAAIASQVIAKNALPQSVLKFYLSAGECQGGKLGFGSDKNFTPHFMVIEDAVAQEHIDAPRGLELYREGITVKCVPFSRDTPEVKSTNYAQAFRALRLGPAAGADDLLFTHHDGYVTEGSTSNFFCVIDGVLTTPKRGMLFGVTRKTLLELASKLGLKVAERDVLPDELAQASEAFMTGSYLEMMSIRDLDGKTFAARMDGPVFAALRKALTEAIRAL